MYTSLLELFSVGVGPSSSHTVGPMRAANDFAKIVTRSAKDKIARITIDLYGSLSLTGKNHGTDTAILNGLLGLLPETIDASTIQQNVDNIKNTRFLKLYGEINLNFSYNDDILWHKEDVLPYHPNGMIFTAYDKSQNIIKKIEYYSVGGGFIHADHIKPNTDTSKKNIPYNFKSAAELLQLCDKNNMNIYDIVFSNEIFLHGEEKLKNYMELITNIMCDSIKRGFESKNEYLPGELKIKKRAAKLKLRLPNDVEKMQMFRLSAYAISASEENASGNRIITAPTNGAAGIIPACLMHCFDVFSQSKIDYSILSRFLLTASAIGYLYKTSASISGAEVGCQGEVGVASSMAAAGITAIMGGNSRNIENAAEIAMEHHLGMTCDPVSGYVQIPCIERNSMGAIKAWNAANLAMAGDGSHYISLDTVIKTMKEIGDNMSRNYKETSIGGLGPVLSQPPCE